MDTSLDSSVKISIFIERVRYVLGRGTGTSQHQLRVLQTVDDLLRLFRVSHIVVFASSFESFHIHVLLEGSQCSIKLKLYNACWCCSVSKIGDFQSYSYYQAYPINLINIQRKARKLLKTYQHR